MTRAMLGLFQAHARGNQVSRLCHKDKPGRVNSVSYAGYSINAIESAALMACGYHTPSPASTRMRHSNLAGNSCSPPAVPVGIRVTRAPAATISIHQQYKRQSNVRFARPLSKNRQAAIPCVIHLPPTCSNAVWISAPFNNSSGIPTCGPRKSILTSFSAVGARCSVL